MFMVTKKKNKRRGRNVRTGELAILDICEMAFPEHYLSVAL